MSHSVWCPHCEICMDIRPYHTQSLWLIMGRILEYRTLHEKQDFAHSMSVHITLWSMRFNIRRTRDQMSGFSLLDVCGINPYHTLWHGFYYQTMCYQAISHYMAWFLLSDYVVSGHITLHVVAVTVGHMWYQSIAQFFYYEMYIEKSHSKPCITIIYIVLVNRL